MRIKIEKSIPIIIGLIVGWFGHLGFISIDNYYNRPKLDFKIQSFVVNQNPTNNWEMHIVLYQENTGNSESIYNLNECKINFPEIQNSPITIKLNKTYTLNQRTHRIDTILVSIPAFFDSLKIDHFASFKEIEMSLKEMRTSESFLCIRDSTEIDFKGKIYMENDDIPTIKDYMTINSKTGDSILIRGTYNIHYNGKDYLNYFLPADSKVSSKLIDDKIAIEYISNINKLPFIFFPHKELEDKILTPNTLLVSGSIEQETDEGKEYKNFDLEKKKDYGDMYFFLFK